MDGDKSKRGGARANSGRKPAFEKVKVHRSLNKKGFDALQKKARKKGISDTEAIDTAIREWTGYERTITI